MFNAPSRQSVMPSMNSGTERPTERVNMDKSLSVEVTTRCNSGCTHCFARARSSESADLAVPLAKEIVREGYREAYRHLHITGGEPLLWEGLPELLDYAFVTGYRSVFLNTNGMLLSEDISRKLAAYDGLSLSISLEGSQTIHDGLRGRGSHRQTVAGVENALAAGLDLYIFTTACKSLLPKMPYFVDELYKKFPGINRLVLIQLFSMTNDDPDFSGELIDPPDFLRFVRVVALLNLYGLKTFLLNNPLAGIASKLLKMPWIPPSSPLCRDGSLIIMANRDICLSHSSKDSFASYESGGIRKALASERYRKAVQPDQSTCPSCGYRKICAENGMVRPPEGYWTPDNGRLYCKKVLDIVVP
jgi:MoaA/NifB/PqqE/SkfB family radical SAM enzyme